MSRSEAAEVGKITGLILAGGRGARMGLRNKAMLPLGGEILLARVRRRLASQVSGIMVAVHGDVSDWAPLCAGCSVVVDERQPRQGPLAGLETALRHVPNDWLLSVPVDVPFFPLDLAWRLGGECRDGRQPIVAMSRGRMHPTVALWPGGMLGAVTAALDRNQRGLNDFLRQIPHVRVEFPDEYGGFDPFFNINTLQDLEEAACWLEFLP
ncbi:MAG: molybdenum cofactor guanylyltransferase [Magnetococcales bacterium]|nr:molybdenum cofactor guanylyltransferase [Magnetococcales bacterium]